MLIFCRNQTFTSPTSSFSIIGANFTLKYMKAMDSSCYTYLRFKCWVYIVINNQKFPLTLGGRCVSKLSIQVWKWREKFGLQNIR